MACRLTPLTDALPPSDLIARAQHARAMRSEEQRLRALNANGTDPSPDTKPVSKDADLPRVASPAGD